MEIKHYKRPCDFLEGLNARLRNIAKSENRPIRSIRRQVAFDRLWARLSHCRPNPWVLKGGHAMELHYRKARATRDMDLTAAPPRGSQPIAATEELAATFRIHDLPTIDDHFRFHTIGRWQPLQVPTIGIRQLVDVFIADQQFDRFHVDLTTSDGPISPLLHLPGEDWLGFAGIAPAQIVTLSKEQQAAEKFHAYTAPRTTPNTRVKDLIDLLLLTRDSQCDPYQLVEKMHSLFSSRGSHPLPDCLFPPPAEWALPFHEMARECGFPLSLQQAFEEIAAYYDHLPLEAVHA
ncbi:MAG: nucleotidyl transferase AbiEii/AbiGii toxin family protein [Parachlamydiales bacterium]